MVAMRPISVVCRQWLVFIMLMLAVAVGGQASAAENLAYNKQYQCSTELLLGWTGLTDGVKDSDQPPACFATDNSPRFPKEVIIDLQRPYQVSKIVVHNSLNGNTRHIGVSISEDLETFEPLREYIFPASQVQPLIHSFAPRSARYVKITLHDTWRRGVKGENCLFLREVEVYGAGPAGVQPGPSAEQILRLAATGPPLVVPHSVQIFRRYCLQSQPGILVGILGDSFAVSDGENQRHWADLFVQQLKDDDDFPQLEVRNLATAHQDPHQGAELLDQLLETETPDMLIIAYGTDAGRARVSPDQFRREFEYLLREAFSKLPALVVVVTPPGVPPDEGPQYSSARVKQALKMAQITEEGACLTKAAVVRTGSVLGRQIENIPHVYEADHTLSSEANQAVATALVELLQYKPTSD